MEKVNGKLRFDRYDKVFVGFTLVLTTIICFFYSIGSLGGGLLNVEITECPDGTDIIDDDVCVDSSGGFFAVESYVPDYYFESALYSGIAAIVFGFLSWLVLRTL